LWVFSVLADVAMLPRSPRDGAQALSTTSPAHIPSGMLKTHEDQPTRSIGMAFNFAALPLQSLGLLAALVFLASLIGHSLSGSSKFLGAIFTVIIFAAAYVFWNYYDHGLMTAIRFRLA
jgi:hypothetical protein